MIGQLTSVMLVVALVAVPARPAFGAGPKRPQNEKPIVVEVDRGGFDWGDAAIGAAGTLGLTGVAAAVVVLRRAATQPRGEDHA